MVKKTESKEKDPAIAAILALVGGVLLGFPGIGYMYVDNMKRGLIYGAISWVVYGILIVAYFGIGIVTFGIGAFFCLPAFALPLIYTVVVTYDTYLYAKGEKTILPEF